MTTTFTIGVGPEEKPGHITRSFTVEASSERGAFHKASEMIESGECIYAVVEKEA